MSRTKSKIRIKDIAEKAGVSIGTVDRVLHNRGEVKEETRKKVMGIVKKMGYTPNLLAKSLASKKTYHFIAIIPDSSDNNPYWKKPLEGIQKGATEIKDYNAIVDVITFNATDLDSFKKACNNTMISNPAGIIIDPLFQEASFEFTKQLDEYKIPYVYIDTDLEKGNNLSYFGQNASQSGQVSAKMICHSLPKESKILIVKLANRGMISHHLLKREEGFIEFFKSHKSCCCCFVSAEIDLLEKSEPANSLDKIFNDNPDIKGIFVPNSRVFKVAKYLSNKPEKPVLLGYDLIEKNIEFLKKGIIDFLIGQKPEEQGYQSVLTLFNHVVANKEMGKTNYSPIDIIIKENLEYYS
jgi:LacI family transcriptional regulator